MRNLYVISINHKQASSETRELLHDAFAKLKDHRLIKTQVNGLVYLHTCNRVELYFEADEDLCIPLWENWVAKVKASTINVQPMIITGADKCQSYILRVALGLESAIDGDDQILGQLKRAFKEARSQNLLSTLLERSLQSIMRCHKQVCRETKYYQHSTSLAYHSLKEAERHFGGVVRDRSVLIIGAGDMARQVVKYMPKFTFAKVYVFNRTQANAYTMVKDSSISVLDREDVAGSWDLVINCIDQAEQYLRLLDIDLLLDLSVQGSNLRHANTEIHLSDMEAKLAVREKTRISDFDKVLAIMDEHARDYEGWLFDWQQRKKLSNLRRA